MAKNKRLVSDLTPDEKEAFRSMVKEMVSLMLQRDSIQNHMKDIRDRAKEELDLKPTEISDYARLTFDTQKVKEKFEHMEEMFSEAEILKLVDSMEMGRNEE